MPRFLRGAFRNAVRVALDEIKPGCFGNDEIRQARLEIVLVDSTHVAPSATPWRHHCPREVEVLFRPLDRVVNEEEALKIARRRSRRQGHDGIVRRAERADQLVHLGAPGTSETLRLLRARPATPRDPLPEDILGHVPDVEFQLDSDQFKRNVRSAKRGVAGGPEHLRVLLDSPRDTQSIFVVSELLARGAVPNSITVLQKPLGGVRGIVAGDVMEGGGLDDCATNQ